MLTSAPANVIIVFASLTVLQCIAVAEWQSASWVAEPPPQPALTAERRHPGQHFGRDDENSWSAPARDLTRFPSPRRRAMEWSQSAEAKFPLYVSLPAIVVLVMLSGLFSMLKLSLTSLDDLGLKIVENGDDPELAKCAAKINNVRQRGNQLLCTLLLLHVAVNVCVAIIASKLFNTLVAFGVATIALVIVSEVIPQAACSHYAVQLGSRLTFVVQILMFVLYIVVKPLSLVLDYTQGQQASDIHTQTEVLERMKVQIELGTNDRTEGEMAKQVAEGALSFRDKLVSEVMTPLQDATMLPTHTQLGYETIRDIFESGFSRIPVYGKDKNDYRGLLYTKDLMFADPEDEMELGDFIQIFKRKVETISKDDTLIKILMTFKKKCTHMGLVREPVLEKDTDPRFDILGVLTLEDIIEEILQNEIVDETDVYVDVKERQTVCDGREDKDLHLEVFNPAWERITKRDEQLSFEESAAIAAHLARQVFFAESGLELSNKAIRWLVAASSVENRRRMTAVGSEEPVEADWIYKNGVDTTRCTLVIQGRLALRAGREDFRAEAGAFSVLAREALRAGDTYKPDYSAFVNTVTARLLTIGKAQYLEARALDRDPKQLDETLRTQAARLKGETSRSEARELHREAVASQMPFARALAPLPKPTTKISL